MIETIAHYRILNRLGAGGMGEVYLAEDTRLGRKVALKLLPAQFTGDEVRVRRFAQEARAASALNHPNIITIYEIGQAEGHQYIATEYVEGETVRRLLAYGRLRPSDALEIAIQTAQALDAAHLAGIIHRDIKPENIMRRPDGYVKILDFGLAKLTERPGAEGDEETGTQSLFQTDPGTVLGTVAYMSPEQARGLALDARTDIFSLGIVLYEMLTGWRPFAGATTSDLLVSILDREPAPLSEHLPGVPRELESIVRRALSKEASARYQSASAFAGDLKRAKAEIEAIEDAQPTISMNSALSRLEDAPTVASKGERSAATHHDPFATSAAAASPTRRNRAAMTAEAEAQPQSRRRLWPYAAAALLLAIGVAAAALFLAGRSSGKIDSIAVLPFINEGAEERGEYLSEGITEGLINSLSQWKELSVMSRNSVIRFKGKEADAQEVGRSLGVRAVLLGRVKQEGLRGEELVISAELVDAETQRRIWGNSFRRKAEDLLALQEQIVRAIADSLELQLGESEHEMLQARPTKNAEAYELYLRGRYYWNQGTPEALKKADEYFERAVGLDPEYGLAYAGCAACHAFGANYDEPPSESMPKAKKVAMLALKNNEKIASAHLVLARVSWLYDWDFETAERKFRRALELDPQNAAVREEYAEFLAQMGREAEAVAEIERARAIDPASPLVNQTAGLLYYYQRRYDESLAQLGRLLDLDPNFAPAREGLAMAYERKKMQLEAIEQYLIARRIADNRPDYLMALKDAYARDGWKGFWSKELSSWQERAASIYVPASKFAEINLRLEQKGQALFWLAKAYDERDGRLVALKVDPIYDPLRAEARFGEIVKRVGLEP